MVKGKGFDFLLNGNRVTRIWPSYSLGPWTLFISAIVILGWSTLHLSPFTLQPFICNRNFRVPLQQFISARLVRRTGFSNRNFTVPILNGTRCKVKGKGFDLLLNENLITRIWLSYSLILNSCYNSAIGILGWSTLHHSPFTIQPFL